MDIKVDHGLCSKSLKLHSLMWAGGCISTFDIAPQIMEGEWVVTGRVLSFR